MEGKLTLFVTVPLVRKHKNSEPEGSNFGNCQQAIDESVTLQLIDRRLRCANFHFTVACD